ncbi:hypothetical protein [Allorhodopirellula heiligendammensis]|uniref:Uncharacterized protein n=1 Tax=Allorhodopirellula heiligendammensis TaxID=2714739 RepID=A0A5C6C7W2_9BACT|nr:hypothetical protein [Allorhodopirellula heiligendammensis]TWU19404.1 hypothetical protein Poly21_15770 [Allorhodopirellula heiligendammensis]
MTPVIVPEHKPIELPRHLPTPTRIASERTPSWNDEPADPQSLKRSYCDEEKYVFQLIGWFLMLILLPAVLTILYMFVNPDAFTTDVTPTTDLSTRLIEK